jgi:hypothetical protein
LQKDLLLKSDIPKQRRNNSSDERKSGSKSHSPNRREMLLPTSNNLVTQLQMQLGPQKTEEVESSGVHT